MVEHPFWRIVLLKQMITRRLKSFLLIALQAKRAHTSTPVRTLINFFNLVFGTSPGSEKFWNQVLLPSTAEYFGPLDDFPYNPKVESTNFKEFNFSAEHDRAFAEAFPHVGRGVTALRYFVDFSKRANVSWSTPSQERFRRYPLNLFAEEAEPFGTTDLDSQGLQLIVK